MAKYTIMALIVNHRMKKATSVQDILTKHGCMIKMRLGLHETGEFCSDEGLVLLQLSGDQSQIEQLEADLNQVEGVTHKTMTISS